MLILSRETNESILIGPDIRVHVVSVSGGRVRLGIEAPKELPVHRHEVAVRIAEMEAKESE